MIDPVLLSGIVRTTDPSPISSTRETVSATPGFADMVSNISNDAVGSIRSAESLSLRALQGDASPREVVDAVMSAERSLQTAIAIRDKIVTAYLEISRMSI